MKKCSNCGNALSDFDLVCGTCGKKPSGLQSNETSDSSTGKTLIPTEKPDIPETQKNQTELLVELANTYLKGSDGEEDTGMAVMLFGKAVETALRKAQYGNASDLRTVICFLEEQITDTDIIAVKTSEENNDNICTENVSDIFSNSPGELHDSFWVKKESDETEPVCIEEIVARAKNFYFGRGVGKDYFEARRLFEIAASKENVQAKKYCAYMSMKGLGGDADYYTAEKFFKEVVDSGETEFYEESSMCLAELYATYLNDIPKAVEIWEKLAINGNIDAQYNYGLALFKGIGTEPEPERGIFWWQNAAEKGHADAKHNLEVLFGKKN